MSLADPCTPCCELHDGVGAAALAGAGRCRAELLCGSASAGPHRTAARAAGGAGRPLPLWRGMHASVALRAAPAACADGHPCRRLQPPPLPKYCFFPHPSGRVVERVLGCGVGAGVLVIGVVQGGVLGADELRQAQGRSRGGGGGGAESAWFKGARAPSSPAGRSAPSCQRRLPGGGGQRGGGGAAAPTCARRQSAALGRGSWRRLLGSHLSRSHSPHTSRRWRCR